MKTCTTTIAVILLSIIMSTVSTSQELSLNGRSAIELNLGFWGGAKASTTIGPTSIRSEAGTNGFTGSVGYSYWLKEHLTLTFTAGLQSAQASSTVSISNATQQSSAVVPLLLGLRFYVPEPQPGENVRPYLSAAVGPYIGSEAANTPLSQQAHVETAAGGRLGLGIDFFPGNHFKLGGSLGYHLMTDFATPIGARKNYNGAEFCLGAGYIF